MFRKGEFAKYTKNDCVQIVLVLEVYFDNLPPYYSVQTKSGKIVDTIQERLCKLKQPVKKRRNLTTTNVSPQY